MSRLVAPVVRLSKQKLITATVMDVLGDLCSVRLSGRGAVLHSLKFIGPRPAKGDSVIVDYRSGIPTVITKTDNVDEKIAEAIADVEATVAETQVTPPPPPESPQTAQPDLIVDDGVTEVVSVTEIQFPSGTVTDVGSGVVSIEFPEGGIEEAPIDGDLYGRKDGAWEVVTGGSGGGFVQLLMEDGVTFPPVPLTNEDGTDWIYDI